MSSGSAGALRLARLIGINQEALILRRQASEKSSEISFDVVRLRGERVGKDSHTWECDHRRSVESRLGEHVYTEAGVN
jgi:hypothetical protein